jgi:hypothetical protein
VDLVDEEDRVNASLGLLEHGLQALSKLPISLRLQINICLCDFVTHVLSYHSVPDLLHFKAHAAVQPWILVYEKYLNFKCRGMRVLVKTPKPWRGIDVQLHRSRRD